MNARRFVDGRSNKNGRIHHHPANLICSETSKQQLLNKDEEFFLARQIDRYRTAFRRRALREPSVLHALLVAIEQFLTGDLREDMLFEVTLRELEKRKSIRRHIQAVKSLLVRTLAQSKSKLDRKSWLEVVKRVEKIRMRFRYYENAPCQDARARYLLGEYQKHVRRLASANLRLVISIRNKIARNQEMHSDLIQEGFRGLMMAVQKFDHRRNIRFSTYATPWIRKAILEALPNQNRLIRIPDRIRGINQKWLNELHKGSSEPGKSEELTCSEIVGCTYIESVRYVRIQADTQSLDRLTDEAGGSAHRQLLIDPSDSVRDKVEKRELIQKLRNAIASLSDQEQAVIRERFGLDDGTPKSLTEVGRRLRYSREHVRQVEKGALAKLMNKLKVNGSSGRETELAGPR